MNYYTLAFGLFALLFGVTTLVLRFKNQEKLGKLKVMKEKYGEKPEPSYIQFPTPLFR